MDILAGNPLAIALSPLYKPGVNVLRVAFLDRAVQDLYDDWEARMGGVVSGLRALIGPDVDDPYLTDLVGELSVKSADFRRLWSRHDVRPQVGGGVHRFQHPQVGELELRFDKFDIAGTDGQRMVIYQGRTREYVRAGALAVGKHRLRQHGHRRRQRLRDLKADPDRASTWGA
jgi:hypothetical protein